MASDTPAQVRSRLIIAKSYGKKKAPVPAGTGASLEHCRVLRATTTTGRDARAEHAQTEDRHRSRLRHRQQRVASSGPCRSADDLHSEEKTVRIHIAERTAAG